MTDSPDIAPGLIPAPAGHADRPAALMAGIHATQQHAALAVKRERIGLHWQFGRNILPRQAQQGWGARVLDRLAHDLLNVLPELKGSSRRNLMYLCTFAKIWPEPECVQQAAARLPEVGAGRCQ